jgi:hypothetical protein
MNSPIRTVFFLVIGTLAADCSKSSDKGSDALPEQTETTAEKRETALTATKEAAQSIQNYAYAQKDEFAVAAKRQLSEMEASMDRLGTKIDRSTGAARADAKAKLAVVSDKWAATKVHLDEAEAATEGAWQDVQNR